MIRILTKSNSNPPNPNPDSDSCLVNRKQIYREICCQSLCHGDLSMTCMTVALIRPPNKMFIVQVNFKITFQQDHIMLCE